MIKKKSIWPYLLLAPALLVIFSVVFFPVLDAILMSFQSYDLRRPKNIAFIGLKNYIDLFKDPQFGASFIRTIIWVVFGVGFQFIIGFMLALLLNRKFKGRGIVRAISMIPWVTPGVLIGLMWKWMYDGNFGVLNDLFMKLHLITDKVAFLANVKTAFPAVIVTIVWQGIPFFTLMLLAALQGVPQELYEAADIDGANSIQKLFFVTIPSIKNTIGITLLLRIIWVANSVDVIFNMTGGGPAYSTQTLSVYTFNKTNVLNLGYASSMAVFLAIILGFVAIPYLKATFKKEA